MIKKNLESKHSQRGQIFILAIVVLGLILINTLVIVGNSLTFNQSSKYSLDVAQAISLAEAGIDKATASINATGGSYNGESETILGDGSYSVTITSKSAFVTKITSTGYIPNKTNPKIKKTIEIELSKGTGISFNYGVQVGDGGLKMSNNARINGSIYSNGNIEMENNTLITGDAFVGGGIQPIADQENDCVSPNCADYSFGKAISDENRLDITQSFKPTCNNPPTCSTRVINKVALKLKKIGSPPNLTVRLLGNLDGLPNKNNVLASGTLIASLVANQYDFVDVIFSPAPSLTPDTTYWIVVDTSSNNTNYWSWDSDTLQGYNRGLAKWSSNWQAGNPSWNNLPNADLTFKTFMGGVPTFIEGDSNSDVQGDVHANTIRDLEIGGAAYYQYSQNITASTYYPNSPDPITLAMPISNGTIQQWKQDSQAINVTTGDITTCPTLLSGKYVGNVSLPNDCTVTVINGPVWITGNLTMSGNNILKLDSSYQGSSGYVIVDGQIVLDNNNSIEGSGTTGSYLILISEFNSRDDPLQRKAIDIRNNGNTGIVYTNLGIIAISNNNNMTEVTGWKLDLSNNVIITYDQGLASSFFSSGPSGSFTPIKGTYKLK